MSDYLPLGKPIRAPEAPRPDVIEDMGNGLYKRNGKWESWIPVPPIPVVHPEPVIITTEQWDAMCGALISQEEDGYPLNEFGVL